MKAVNSSCNLGKADSAPLPAPRSRTRTPPAPPAEIRFIDHTAWRKRCDRAFRLAESFWTGHNNEKIGDIQELIVDKSGKVDKLVLGVGGFLGMGEHYVAVPMEKLRWVNEPVRTSSTAPADKSTVGEANRANRQASEKWYPDHAVFNATKDQLKAMPEFKYN